MPNISKRSETGKKNRAKGLGRRPNNSIVCGICSSSLLSPYDELLFHPLDNINIEYSGFDKIIFEDEDDKIINIDEDDDENTITINKNDIINHELEICEKFNLLMLEVNVNNKLIFKKVEDCFKGVTKNLLIFRDLN